MKRLYLFILLALIGGGSSNAVALEVGQCDRQGDTIVCNLGCRAFNMADFNKMWPQGLSTVGELGIIAAASQRDLTPEEIAICTGEPVVIPMWRVAANGKHLTRPAKEISEDAQGNLILVNSTGDVRYGVGQPCENSIPIFSLSSTGGREWRYFAGQTQFVVLCEYK